MQRLDSFLQRFRRVTYSTTYIPQIDGLRFLAIFSVVAVMHVPNYINQVFYAGTLIQSSFWKNFNVGGGTGVSLFFMISGFVLSLPFARWRLLGERPVLLPNYYKRRLFRLEPPYLVALLFLFIAQVWIIGQVPFSYLLPRFLASAAYLHTAIYNGFSPVLPVAWSLEVEVQFYLLAPLFFLLFLVPLRWLRWLVCALVITGSAVYWYDVWKMAHVFLCLHFFFCGILLADLYVSRVVLIRNERLGLIAGLAALGGYFFLDALHSGVAAGLRLLSMFVLFHTVLTNAAMKRLFSGRLITSIGGMCYSIYLLHLAVVSAIGLVLQKFLRPGTPHAATALGLFLLFLLGVLVVSGLFFLGVEKPFMRPLGVTRREKLKRSGKDSGVIQG